MNEERPIEKLLRRYAKKRRADAGAPELHPATRRLLQDEVARQFPQSAAGGTAPTFGQILRSWLPWLGLATVLFVVVGLGVRQMLHQREEKFALAPTSTTRTASEALAKNEPQAAAPKRRDFADYDTVPRKESALQPAPAPVAPPAPAPTLGAAESRSVVSARSIADESKDNRLAKAAEGAGRNIDLISQPTDKKESPTYGGALKPSATPPGAPAPGNAGREQIAAPDSLTMPAPDGPLGRASGKFTTATEPNRTRSPSDPNQASAAFDKSGARGGGAQALRPQPPAAPASAQTVAVTDLPLVAGNYTSVPAAENEQAYKSLPSPAVLTSFRVEQTGSQIRVIDADGSTYTGDLSPALSGPANEEKQNKDVSQLKLKQPAISLRATGGSNLASQTQRSYFYRVAGTNLTLNQAVEFSWNFIGATNEVLKAQPAPSAGALIGEKEKAGSVASNLLQNSAITGRARLGAEKEFEIKAQAVAPPAAPVDGKTMKVRRD